MTGGPTMFVRGMFSTHECDVCGATIRQGALATFVRSETSFARTCGAAACLRKMGVPVGNGSESGGAVDG